MILKVSGHPPLFACSVALAVLFAAAGTSPADQDQRSDGIGPLDGMIFVGKIGPESNPDFDEELHFNNGQFWSKNCVSCGFQPSPYWVRSVNGGVLFQGELSNRDDSVFRYSGNVRDGHIDVTVRWTKDRWYWSIDQSMVFKGTLETTRSAISSAKASQTADTALLQQLPQWCP